MSNCKERRMQRKIVAVISCYNEEPFIGEVIDWAKALCDHIVVSDDSSTDNSVEECVKRGVFVCCNPGVVRGAGSTLQRGIDFALQLNPDIIVTLDGDGQHNPIDISAMVKPILDGKAHITIGSRFLEKDSDLKSYRKLGIQVITYLLNIGSKTKYTDGQCCFRAFTREALEEIKTTDNGFSFSVEMLIKARRLGYRAVEVPIFVVYHSIFSANSTSNPVIHGLKVCWGVLKWRTKIELFRRR